MRGLAARFLLSAVLLALLARALDVGAIVARLSDLRPAWVGLALALSVPQVLVLAWRWRFTARRLGLELPFRTAVAEYYLSLFLNQALPGGVVGDVSRAWRHARTDASTGEAVRAVVLERASAQVVMTTVACVCLLALPFWRGGTRAALAALLAAGVAAVLLAARRRAAAGAAGALRADLERAVLAPEARWAHLATASLLVASYVAVFVIAARAIGVGTDLAVLLPLVAPVLMTMLIPVTIAGWGVREGAAAALWSVAGLTPEEGVAVSVAYGVVTLAASAPGALVLSRALLSGRGRTGRPSPDGSSGTVGGAPRGGPRSERA